MSAAKTESGLNARSGRSRSLIVPREHGAWGILLIPLFTGASAGLLVDGDGKNLIALILVALALFWLRTPVEGWAGTVPVRARTPREFRLVRAVALLLVTIAISGLAWLLWNGQNLALIWIGCAAAIAFLVQLFVRRMWKNARTEAQMVGAAGLTSTAPAAYYVVTGHLNAIAWSLWAANLLFAINQIHYVQLRIQAARVASRREQLVAGSAFLAQQLVLIALIAFGCLVGVFPWYGATAFLPVLVRGFMWFADHPKPLAIHSLGKSELAYACLFGVLLVMGMRFA
ncbi:MAG: YwiC-like family protein [Bryobacteraceae bacterium]